MKIDLTSRGSLERAIVGALRSAISAHGPITLDTAPSAAKRVIHAIKDYNRRQATPPDDRPATLK